jgi:hypothetical protein
VLESRFDHGLASAHLANTSANYSWAYEQLAPNELADCHSRVGRPDHAMLVVETATNMVARGGYSPL